MLTFVSIFIFLTGLIIGLGAVTVIDIHGFLGRKSSYWTEATIRTHKVTKPLIWIGIILTFLGGIFFYSNLNISTFLYAHLFLVSILVVNGLFLSFYVSPYLLKMEKEGNSKELLPQSLQLKISLSFIFSIIGWWSIVLIFAYSIYGLFPN